MERNKEYEAITPFEHLQKMVKNNQVKKPNMVDKPSHYIGINGLEVEEVLRNFIPKIKDPYVAHRVASAIEYLLRHPEKNGNQDIEKAGKNLDQALEYIKELTE